GACQREVREEREAAHRSHEASAAYHDGDARVEARRQLNAQPPWRAPLGIRGTRPRVTIQWYPGHMTKARRNIADAMPNHDVVIEVLDARMPRASENPALRELRGSKPCVKVLAKADLADPEATRLW